jgi:hypothetical protein
VYKIKYLVGNIKDGWMKEKGNRIRNWECGTKEDD